MSDMKTSNREVVGRRAYEIFRGHYRRLHGAELPLYDQLGTASANVWNATAVDLMGVEIPLAVAPPERT